MANDFSKIIQELKAQKYLPVYLLDGDEPYFSDVLIQHFEDDILSESERDFNLSVFYGKDANTSDIIATCRRFPMFSERQVVIIKDAVQLRDLNQLVSYLENFLPTTILVIDYRNKKMDARSKLVKMGEKIGVRLTSEKIKIEKMPNWVMDYGKQNGIQIGEEAAQLLTIFLGNDLQKLINELEKVKLNLDEPKILSTKHIQKYMGISRDYNIFELPDALTSGNEDAFFRIVQYYLNHPKQIVMMLVNTTFYMHFSRMYQLHFTQGHSDADAAKMTTLGNPYFVKKLRPHLRHWPIEKVKKALLILAENNAKDLGVGAKMDHVELMKELMGKLYQLSKNNLPVQLQH